MTRDGDLKEKVLAVVRSIPPGETMSYKQVALKAGFPNHARVVGRLMAHNFDETIPCHRVIKHNGQIGQYNRGGTEKKRAILLREGFLPQK